MTSGDKILNPGTGRYVLKSGKIGNEILNSKCADQGKELNPVTYRCNKIKESPTKAGGKKSPCPTGKVRDKDTKRCRSPKKRGPSESPKKRCDDIPTKAPTGFSNIPENCLLNDKWVKKKKIGQGADGKVYQTCRYNNCEYVLKVQSATSPDFKREVAALKLIKGFKHAPKVFECGSVKN